jgi:hypothetical protein
MLDVLRTDTAVVSPETRWRAVRRRPRRDSARGSRGSVCLDGLAVLGMLAWAVTLLLTVVALAVVTAVRPMAAGEVSASVAAPDSDALELSACVDEPARGGPLAARDCVARD